MQVVNRHHVHLTKLHILGADAPVMFKALPHSVFELLIVCAYADSGRGSGDEGRGVGRGHVVHVHIVVQGLLEQALIALE